MRTAILSLLIILGFTIVNSANAADVQWSSRLTGTAINSSDQFIVDGDFASVLLNTYTDVKQLGYIRLGIDDAVQMEFRGTRTIDLNIDVVPYNDNNVAQATSSIVLSVTYSHDGNGVTVDAADYRLPGYHKFRMTVTGVTIKDETSAVVAETIPDYIFLEGGIVAERYYQFNPASQPTVVTNMIEFDTVTGVANTLSTSTINSATDEVYLSWNYVPGAEYYDVEWTWVDNYSESGLTNTTAASAITMDEPEFRHNSTRIRTNDQFYRIPHTFGRGYLIYRVRAVGRWLNVPSRDLFGAWSSGSGATHVSNWSHLEITHEHEFAKNWQYQATYAEEGKKKEVIQYFDGSLRSRQTVTRINSDDNSVVGETVYDNQGRGTIQILPVPQNNPAIQYYASLNLSNTSGDSYSHLDFDWETSTSNCVADIPGALDASTGSSHYYSVAGHTTDTDWQQYVPEANGYAFTQVEYTPDNTGRIRAQSGVGSDFTLGSGHETKYYYGQPAQEELNRLYGYKSGLKRFYKKNMVVDANGQVSISYLDAQGRVIATSLAGANATPFESLDSEQNGNHNTLTVDLLNKLTPDAVDTLTDDNDLISTGAFGTLEDGLEMSTQITVVSNNTEHDFNYTVQAGFYEEFCNGVQGVKFPYIYDLVLSLKDDCGNEIFTQTYDTVVGDQNITGTVSEFLTVSSQLENHILAQGTYTLTKRLTVNRAAFDEHLLEYLDHEINDCLLDSSAFSNVLSTDCSLSCEECVEELGSLSEFLQQAELDEGAPLTTAQVGEYTNVYNQLKDDCLAPCEILTPCEAYKGTMLQDFMPNGQYAIVDVTNPTSVFNPTNIVGVWYQSPNLDYKDEFGNDALVEAYPDGSGNGTYGLTDSGNGGMQLVPPSDLNLQSYVAAFEMSWAEAFFPMHPEYDYYLYAEEICNDTYAIPSTGGTTDFSSDEFDAILRDQINTYELAGTGTNGNPYGIDFIAGLTNAIYDIDPYFNQSYTVHGSLTTLKEDIMVAELANYGNPGNLSLTQAAVKLAVFPNDPTVTTPTNANTWTAILAHTPYDNYRDQIWQQYKMLYLSKKAAINQFFIDLHGMAADGFNGCIGPDEFSTGVLTSFNQNAEFSDMVTEYFNVVLTGGTIQLGVFDLCVADFNSKDIRVVRTDALFNPTLPAAAMAQEGQEMTDYAQWEATGLCPLTIDMERLIDELAVGGLIASTNQMPDVHTLVPDLYEAITGLTWSTSSELEMDAGIVGTDLVINFDHPTLHTNYCTLTIPQVGGNTWVSYGSSWHIYGVYNSYPTGVGNNTMVIIKAGATQATANEYVVTYTTGCANLNGCQSTYAFNNQYDPDCTKEEEFENGITAVLIEIANNGHLNNTTVVVDTLSSFTNSVLPDYFDGTVTWNGTTGIFTFTNGFYKTGFIPPSGTFFFQSYDIVGNTAYSSYFSDTSNFTAGSSSAGYTYNSDINTLDFNCSCLETLEEESVDALLGAGEDLFLELFNYILANPTTPNGTAVPMNLPMAGLEFNYDNPAFYEVAVSTTDSLSFHIDESPVRFCSDPITLNWSGFTIDSILSVDLEIYDNAIPPYYEFTIEAIDQTSPPTVHTFTSISYYGDCPLIDFCNDCDPTLLEPISCTDQYDLYYTLMMNTFEDDYQDLDPTMDEDSVFIFEYIGSEEDFCAYSYAYIYGAYAAYLNEFMIQSVNDPMFLTIGQFGSTELGYVNSDLTAAVSAYEISNHSNPNNSNYLPWNEYVSTVYIEEQASPGCPPVLPTPPFPPTQQIIDCNQWINNVLTANQQNQYNIYLDQITEAFMQAYVEGAMSSAVETFSKTTEDKEYHYTLYYYDRAGNLAQTVPPKGVDRLEEGAPNTLTNVQINDFRISDPEETQNTINGTKHAPEHTYETVYRYNSLNQLVYQATPDGGESRFAYDALGRLVMSQNAKQKSALQYSYTKYDELGRVVEVGELTLSIPDAFLAGINDNGRFYTMDELYPGGPIGPVEYVGVNSSNFPSNLVNDDREEVTRTVYDEAIVDGTPLQINVTDDFSLQTTMDYDIVTQFDNYGEDNTRNRIVAVVYQEEYNDTINKYESAIYYDYDIHGNVQELIQVYEHDQTKYWNQHVKYINYEYDLVSGNVNEVVFQRDREDQFIHRYDYDADNRITIAETSKDGIFFETDAKYFYYDHGPLARTEIGDKQVQASDFAYTIQGWIKAVNGEEVDETTMMGEDGRLTTLNENVARDLYGYSLHYYENDFEAADTTMLSFSKYLTAPQESSQHGSSLYNGNIRAMYTVLSELGEVAIPVHQTKYRYDQLNRIKSMDGFYAVAGSPNPSFVMSGYNASYSFDANGNLEYLKRYAHDGTTGILMDDFVYNYDETTTTGGTNNNQLSWVDDIANATGGYVSEFAHADIDGSMNSGNYEYDAIGQLVQDADEGILHIAWKVTNKVDSIHIDTDSDLAADKFITFDYDPMGNRIAKHVDNGTDITSTFYILDAQGNQMTTYKSTYTSLTNPAVALSERMIYGSSRIGVEYADSAMSFAEITDGLTHHVDFSTVTIVTGTPPNEDPGTWAPYDVAGGPLYFPYTVTDHDSDGDDDMIIHSMAVPPNPNLFGSLWGYFSTIPGEEYTFNFSVLANGFEHLNGYYTTPSGTSLGQVNCAAVNTYATTFIAQSAVTRLKYFAIDTSPGTSSQYVISDFWIEGPGDVLALESIVPEPYFANNEIGDKRYEFSNHLGNVLEVLTDRKLPVEATGAGVGTIEYFTADVVQYNDYYPYGMVMPGGCTGGDTVEYQDCAEIIVSNQTIVDDHFNSGVVENWVTEGSINTVNIFEDNGRMHVTSVDRYRAALRSFETVPGETYTIDLSIDIGQLGNVSLGYRDIYNGYAYNAIATITSSGTYQYTFTAIDEVSMLRLAFPNEFVNLEFWVDYLTVTGAKEVNTCDQDFLVNDDFSSTQGNWAARSNPVSITVANDQLLVEADSRGDGIQQTITTVTGEEYFLDFTLSGVDEGNAERVLVRVFDVGTNTLLPMSNNNLMFQDGRMRLRFTAIDTSTYIEFYAESSVAFTPRSFALEEVSVYSYVAAQTDSLVCYPRHGSDAEYRYGFQGQEKDDEIKGQPGNSINYRFRMHDPRVGRFFAIDPLTAKYPWYTPYQFSGNKVIHAIELEGLEEYALSQVKNEQGEVVSQSFDYYEDLEILENNDDIYVITSYDYKDGVDKEIKNIKDVVYNGGALDPTPAPDHIMDTRHYYSWRARDFRLRHTLMGTGEKAPDYYMDYGDKYVKRFEDFSGLLSEYGQGWVKRARYNLQAAMEKEIMNNSDIERDADAFKSMAYGTHAYAYWKAGSDNLSIIDLGIIGLLPDEKDLLTLDGVTQAFVVGKSWVDKNINEPVNETVKDAVDQTLKKKFAPFIGN